MNDVKEARRKAREVAVTAYTTWTDLEDDYEDLVTDLLLDARRSGVDVVRVLRMVRRHLLEE